MPSGQEGHQPNGQAGAALASPSKAFFIDMLTQDIGLTDCILDLIDNAIHSLVTKIEVDIVKNLIDGTKPPRLKQHVEVAFTSSRFSVADNCGGITKKEATEQVFLLGKPKIDKKHPGLGVYGIGMKRAFFKIGREITVTSNVGADPWQIDINVDEWEDHDDWRFPFTDPPTKSIAARTTGLEVRRLNPPIAAQFGNKTFQSVLESRLSSAYALFLKAGLAIKVNKVSVSADLPEILESNDVKSVRKLLKEDGVDILIQAGITPSSDRIPRGWYVFCNGRLILSANQSEQTGWGVAENPAFHSKYNHFVGFVIFRSKDVRKLPWTTTKDSIVRESPIYQRALAEMRVQIRPILNFFNDLYPSDAPKSEPEARTLDKAKAVPLEDLSSKPNETFTARVPKTSDDDLVNILYKRPKRKIKKIAAFLGKPSMAAYRVGEKTFDEFFKRHCE